MRVDITYCANGKDCPKRHTCRRWRHPANTWTVSFLDFYRDNTACDAYWEVT